MSLGSLPLTAPLVGSHGAQGIADGAEHLQNSWQHVAPPGTSQNLLELPRTSQLLPFHTWSHPQPVRPLGQPGRGIRTKHFGQDAAAPFMATETRLESDSHWGQI